MFEYRQSTPFRQDIKQPHFALYGQDTWRVSPNITLNYGARWEPWFPQDSEDGAFYSFDIDRWRTQTRSRVFPQAPPGLNYPGDEGFPGNTGMKTVWTNIAPRVGISWDPKADGRMSIRAGYGMTGDFVTGQFFFDSRSAPPFGLEQRLNGSLLDDPWGRSAERIRTDLFRQLPVELRALSAYITVPYDIKTTRNHSWNVGLQQQIGDNMAYSVTYLGTHLFNVWGVVDGNPALVTTPGATATAPCSVQLPNGSARRSPTATIRSISGGSSVLRTRHQASTSDIWTMSSMQDGRIIRGCCSPCSADPHAESPRARITPCHAARG